MSTDQCDIYIDFDFDIDIVKFHFDIDDIHVHIDDIDIDSKNILKVPSRRVGAHWVEVPSNRVEFQHFC